MVFLSLPKKAGPETVNEIISQTWAGGSFRGDRHTQVHTRTSTLGLSPHCGCSLSQSLDHHHHLHIFLCPPPSELIGPFSTKPWVLTNTRKGHTWHLGVTGPMTLLCPSCDPGVVDRRIWPLLCAIIGLSHSMQPSPRTMCHVNGFHEFNSHNEPLR
jgi:hypothetical protein